MLFTEMTTKLQKQLKSNLPQLMMMVKNNPAMAYTKITEIGFEVGRPYNLKLLVNFPKQGKIEQFDYYGKRDLSIIIDRLRTKFPIERSIIRDKAAEIFEGAQINDAYMYEGKEGLRILFADGRIDVLPHSFHVWCLFDDKVTKFCDWLLENAYDRSQPSATSS